MSRRPLGPKAMFSFVLVLALGILAGAVMAGFWHLHRVLRAQLVNRDGEILYAVAQAQQSIGPVTNLAQRLKTPIEQLALALQISLYQIHSGVLGVRLFDAAGRFVTALPLNLTKATLDARACASLRELRPLSRYYSHADLADYFPDGAGQPARLARPCRCSRSIYLSMRAARGSCWLARNSWWTARTWRPRLAALDSSLRAELCEVFVCGGALLGGVLMWAYRRLERINRPAARTNRASAAGQP